MDVNAETLDPNQAAQAARSKARVRQLLRAAARLMTTSGSQNVSMQAVAEEANVSVGLIYRYFSSKQELVKGVIVGVLVDMAVQVPAAHETDVYPVRLLASVIVAFLLAYDVHTT